ncbi:exodeoxyribonuclease V subunit beta [Aquabacterium sp. OR-4]|uniref:exodeoxyribonuclease V subunit beta n=1 Tax=Aquabacterium sp. OR-4 TaxID=2978127 RepID=UPI0021B309FB|nr:exodeoxyribonuclease V subunit beta [Aquabacterium sp. OR-4]MDT7833653.1 exodeoxyribonuclease V subunit beta [Aquabacterium sp. OR-4]
MTTPILQPLSFALRGSRLIEASAGTGKTFTIAALYLRLVLGHGGAGPGGCGFTRPLVPPEILVVTFTEAATQELRDRIRARLAEAAVAFLADPVTVPDQPAGRDLLHDLRASYPADQWPACARTLRLAAEWMDEAAVSTIHGWCYRMLREHAFDSGSLFTQTLETDQRELLAEALRDYWRSFFTPLPADDAAQVRAWWPTPDALRAEVAPLLARSAALGPGQAPAQALGQARAAQQQALAELKAPWPAWVAELRALLDAAVAAKQVDGRKLQARYYGPWLDALAAWAGSELPRPDLDSSSSAWTRLTPEGLADAWKLGAAPEHPALRALPALRGQLEALPTGREDLLRHAADWTARRLQREQAQRALMGFDELLTRLDAALQGPNGARLAQRIRTQFPVALIDEFQDTDPVQYRIVDTIYRVADNDAATALVLIGDPKQAIYAFRGADIHTYLAARRDTGDRHATLGTNFRSSQAMVAAVNQVFQQAEARAEGAGAFLFRHGGHNPLPFQPVDARGRGEQWWRGDAPAPALVLWQLPAGPGGAALSATAALQQAAQASASEIVRLLAEGQAGRAGFAEHDALQGVQPGDMAVLVNNGREAAAVQAALRQRGVRSVYLSDKGSVFDSAVAADLQRWLAACAAPDDDRTLRAALGSATLGLDWAALDRLNHDELAWEARVLQFRGYRQMWRRQGVLPMLRHLLHDFAVPQRLLAAPDGQGERLLTDLLHLAELLQHAAVQLDGEHALIRHLAEQRADATGDGDARKLRLESDAALVKVVTVHKSKGLEYPLVFLPFACAFRATRPDDTPLTWHDDAGQPVVALRADAQALARVDQERLGEDLRKLYVALTRARHATWVGMAPLKELQRSAFGSLLSGGAALPPEALGPALQALARGCPAIAVQPLPPADDTRHRATSARPDWAPPPEPPGPRERWWIASYTALRAAPALAAEGGVADGGATGAAASADPPATPPASAAEETFAEALAEQGATGATGVATGLATGFATGAATGAATGSAPAAVSGALHAFARGAEAGSFLHGVLEWAGTQGFAQAAQHGATTADWLARRCASGPWRGWAGPLARWLSGWLATPLDLTRLTPGSTPLAPAQLAAAQMQVELEFWFAAQRVDTAALDALVTRHTLGGAARPPLAAQQLNGMLKGFIDWVFEHEGRWYVADHKSNWLGPRDADYTPAALREAVLHHRYELQYALYLLALHRLLKCRLPGYDYEQHIGGAVYLFLRGHAAAGQGLHLERPPRALIEALDALFDGGEALA